MIRKIVLTGGPCGGKSSALPFLENKLKSKGCYVVTVPETATLLFNNGFILAQAAPATTIIKQTAIIKFQMAFEDTLAATSEVLGKPIWMICDRGVMDAKAYSGIYWDTILEQNNWSEEMFLKRYDIVCHLTSAAIGTNLYTKANNAARFETAEEAIEADRRTQDAWHKHHCKFVVDNSTDFDNKLERMNTFIEREIYSHQ